MAKLKVDLNLIQKYDVPGPRYTSYPTAPHFTDDIGWDSIRKEIIRSNEENSGKPISLYFHLPFCRQLCWYCGCTNVITQSQVAAKEYLYYLNQELEMVTPFISSDRKVVQLHFGGGSPTFFMADEIRKLGEYIHQRFCFMNSYEGGIEIDPRTVSEEKIKAYAEIGFNRVSIGVQDLDQEVLKTVNRVQTYQQSAQTIEWARAAGIKSINIDLMYGLPKQTCISFDKTLDKVLEFKPDRFAVFNYAHVPWLKKAQAVLTPLRPEEKMAILKLTIEKLTSNGYVYIGMDHFARETDELALAQKNKTLQRNFQGYSTHAGADIYSFGMSSISQTNSAYWQNEKDLLLYYSRLNKGEIPQKKAYILTRDDQIRHQTIMRLMCDLELDYHRMSKLLDIDFKQYFKPELLSLKEMESDGLLVLSPDFLKITDMGRLLIRNIAMSFDAYLKSDKQKKFSRTI